MKLRHIFSFVWISAIWELAEMWLYTYKHQSLPVNRREDPIGKVSFNLTSFHFAKIYFPMLLYLLWVDSLLLFS